jgi:hypothetical protein
MNPEKHRTACPVCEAETPAGLEMCPRCGARVGSFSDQEDPGVVEGTAERGPISAELPLPDEAEVPAGAAGPDRAGAAAQHPNASLVLARPSLPAVIWQQPAVRAVAQAGAGAVALTIGMRLLRAWLSRPSAPRRLVSSALPLVADVLEQGDRPTLPQAGRVERGTEVVETFVYMHRVIRRR